MDTRSVVRSRRRSARLTGQSSQEHSVEPPTTSKRRDSGHSKSANSSSSTSREPSCPPADPNPKTALSGHDAHPASQDLKTAKASAKDEDNGNVLPLFPNLRSSKAKYTETSRAETESIITPPTKPVDTSSEKAVKSQVSTKWVKTARGSIRLASDSIAEDSNNFAGNKYGEAHDGQNASSTTAGRRSRRLTCMVPDVRDETIEIEPLHSRRLMAIKATAPAFVALGSDKLQESFTQATAEPDSSTHGDFASQDDFPTHDGKSDPRLPQPDVQQDTSPIPELLADIERIIQSSPLADQKWTDDGTEGATTSTPSQTLKKRAPANVFIRSRTLRSSARSINNTGKTGKNASLEKTDSDSSQFDGAFDDVIRSQRRKKTHASTAHTSKPREPRGSKRSVQELSEAEGLADSPSLRQRRKPDSDGPKPVVDFGSPDLIEEVTSRGAFSANENNTATASDHIERARRSKKSATPAMTAPMTSTNPERAHSAHNSNLASKDSQQGSQLQGHGEDTQKCADCGKVLARYLVCAKCQDAIYCGKYCQIWNWPLHKTRCHASDEAVQAEVEQQEAYLGDMWAATVKMLKEENMAGGTVESLLLGEAVRHSATRPAFMGQGRPRYSVTFDADSSQSASQNMQSLSRTRAMSIRMAQAAHGGDE